METIWFCCQCSYRTCGVSSRLHPSCVNCQEPRCPDCIQETVFGEEAGGRGPLYPRNEKDGVTIEREALRGDHHEFGALQETTQPFTERASQLRAKSSSVDQIPFNYSAATKETSANTPEPVPLLHYGYNETRLTGPISGDESEISRPSLVYADADRECTPHSCPDTTDPSDSPETIDKDANSASRLFGEGYVNPRIYHNNHSDLSANLYYQDPDPIDELLLNTGGAEDDEFGPFDLNLEIAYDGADAVQPQRLQWDAPGFGFPTDVNAYNAAFPLDNFKLPDFRLNDTIESLSMPYQMPATESPTDQSETSPPPAPFAPGHQNPDRQLITENGHASQDIRACMSCLATAELDGKPLACVFYKFNPNAYFRCSSREFKTIGHLRQHLDKYHKLKEYDCKRCWASFSDEGSLKRHTECQPMGGIPVNDLGPISKARGINPNTKWLSTFKQLFGENIPLPECPYPHAKQDFQNYTVQNFVRDLEAKGTALTLDQIKEVAAERRAQTMPRSRFIVDR
ncbi:hypothetical protein F4805DRAFT_44381 [Annulohypoxylon moriforme]|nr:hypothetical protein F4805DRAFT_44381 [Annulohypoxylon moriforme]